MSSVAMRSFVVQTELYRLAYGVHRLCHQPGPHFVAVQVVHCPACHTFLGEVLAARFDHDARRADQRSPKWYQQQIGAAFCPEHRAAEVKEATLAACQGHQAAGHSPKAGTLWSAPSFSFSLLPQRVLTGMRPARRYPTPSATVAAALLRAAVAALLLVGLTGTYLVRGCR